MNGKMEALTFLWLVADIPPLMSAHISLYGSHS